MSDDPRRQTTQEEHDIANLLIRWGHARDSDDWDMLEACFHGDASIHISWISASAREFVARSRTIAKQRSPGSHTKHLITGPWIQINGDRAFSRCNVNLYVRAAIGGHEVDVESWFRFFDLLEQRDGVWRIVKRTGVYEKDRLDPVNAHCLPENYLADMDLSSYPECAKHLCYLQQLSGRPAVTNIISVYSTEETDLREGGARWLAGG
ncbi:nuclear transport factor 2 family protein [Alphaproteobacteria bacterium]|nr:nuclear transport factor 2 family protein [Alphaproteobacteria bacterium]